MGILKCKEGLGIQREFLGGTVVPLQSMREWQLINKEVMIVLEILHFRALC